MFLVHIFNYEIDTAWLIFMLTVIGGLTWWLVVLYFTVKNLKEEIIENRTTNIEENKKTKADIAIELQRVNEQTATELRRVNEETRIRETKYGESITHITNLVDNHTKDDERKFSQILNSLSEISSKMAVAVDRIGLIIDGRLGGGK